MNFIIEWIGNHQTEIATFFTSGTFLTVVLLIRNIIKDVAANTLAGNKLTASLTNLVAVKDELSDVKLTNDGMSERLDKVLEAFRVNTNHVDALIDMIALLCSHSKDEDVRNQTSLIVNSLKYKDDLTVNELQKEIEELKQKLQEKTEQAIEPVVEETKPDEAPVKSVTIARG